MYIEMGLPNKHHFNLTEVGNKRNRRSRRGQSSSLERDLRASEAEASHGIETMIETLSNFDTVRDKEAVLIDPTQNENEMQVWTRRETDNTNREMAELRKEMNEKLEKMMRKVKNSRKPQSIPNRKNNGKPCRE